MSYVGLSLRQRLSFRRSLTSYTRVRTLIGNFLRCKPVQLEWIQAREYLNAGCGPNLKKGFINLDYEWLPGVLCWDLRRPLSFRSRSFRGIYSEHCLEHLSREDCLKVLREFRRILRPGGLLRIVVPDVEIYIDLYMRARNGEQVYTPYNAETPLSGLNRIMREHGHQYAYDFEAMKAMLLEAGFTTIFKQSFNKGWNSHLLIDSEERESESLYVEASFLPTLDVIPNSSY